MPDREPDLKLLSSKIYEFVCGLLEEEHEPAAICLGLTSHVRNVRHPNGRRR